jgi:tetratricopeptide (TPR) repeat protein
MDDDTRRSRAYLQQARYAAGQDDNQAMLHAAEAAIGAARRAGNVTLEVKALIGKVQALTDSGEHAAAQRTANETIVRAQGIEDGVARNAALGDVAYFYLEAGDLVRGLELLSQGAEAARQTGDRRKVSQCDVNIGFTLAQLGLYAPARATLEAGLALAEATSDRRLQARHTINLGFVHWRSGDRDMARQLVEQALGEFKATGDAYGQAACLAYLGFMREEAEDWDAAAEYLAQARAGFARIGVDSDRIEAQAAAARCALAQGRREEAHRLALEVWDDVCEHGIAALDSPSRVCLHLAAVLAVTGLPDSHVSPHQVLEAGYRALMELADKLSNPEWRRSFLENVAENRAIVAWWQRLQENC